MNTQGGDLPKPQIGTKNIHDNKWVENSDTLEEQNSNVTGVKLEGINSDPMEQLMKELLDYHAARRTEEEEWNKTRR